MEPKLVPLETDDHLMTIAEFADAVKSGGFIDYDGMGDWATATHKHEGDFDAWVKPSTFASGKQKPPTWATHIVWYNR